jgi:SEL1 protein
MIAVWLALALVGGLGNEVVGDASGDDGGLALAQMQADIAALQLELARKVEEMNAAMAGMPTARGIEFSATPSSLCTLDVVSIAWNDVLGSVGENRSEGAWLELWPSKTRIDVDNWALVEAQARPSMVWRLPPDLGEGHDDDAAAQTAQATCAAIPRLGCEFDPEFCQVAVDRVDYFSDDGSTLGLSIYFDRETNTPEMATSEQVASLLSFSQPLPSSNYSGAWETKSQLNLRIHSAPEEIEQALDVGCPGGASETQGVCFWAVMNPDKWTASQDNCGANGGILATATTAATFEVLVKLRDSIDEGDMWIGLAKTSDRCSPTVGKESARNGWGWIDDNAECETEGGADAWDDWVLPWDVLDEETTFPRDADNHAYLTSSGKVHSSPAAEEKVLTSLCKREPGILKVAVREGPSCFGDDVSGGANAAGDEETSFLVTGHVGKGHLDLRMAEAGGFIFRVSSDRQFCAAAQKYAVEAFEAKNIHKTRWEISRCDVVLAEEGPTPAAAENTSGGGEAPPDGGGGVGEGGDRNTDGARAAEGRRTARIAVKECAKAPMIVRNVSTPEIQLPAEPHHRIQGVLSLTGETEALQIQHKDLPTTMPKSWAISMWVFLHEGPTGKYRTFFFKGDKSGERTPSAWLLPDSQHLAMKVSTKGNQDLGLNSTSPLPVQEWVHLVFSFSNETAQITAEDEATAIEEGNKVVHYRYQLFINGKHDTTITYYEKVEENHAALHIGDDPFFDGIVGFMSEVSIYGKGFNSKKAMLEYTRQKHNHLQKQGGLRGHVGPRDRGKGSHHMSRMFHEGSLFNPLHSSEVAAFPRHMLGTHYVEHAPLESMDAVFQSPATQSALLPAPEKADAAVGQSLLKEAEAMQTQCGGPLMMLDLLVEAGEHGNSKGLYNAGRILLGIGKMPRDVDDEEGCQYTATERTVDEEASHAAQAMRELNMRGGYGDGSGDEETYLECAASATPDRECAAAGTGAIVQQKVPQDAATTVYDVANRGLLGPGGGLRRDVARAQTYLHRSAAMGNVEAMRLLGFLLTNGHATFGTGGRRHLDSSGNVVEETLQIGGTPAGDVSGSVDSSKGAIDQGKTGDIDSTDLAYGVALYHTSALGDDTDAQLMLANRYLNGEGVERSMDAAAFYYMRVAHKAHEAYHVAGQQPHNEMQRISYATLDTVEEGQKGDDDELLQWQKQRAEEGHIPSMMAMGDLYYWGARGFERDQILAFSFFMRAADLGNANGQSAAAGMLLKGEGCEKDLGKAVELYELAAEQGSIRALNGLGYAYFFGGALEQNQTKAFELFDEAARIGTDGDSMFNAAHCLQNGLGVPKDSLAASVYYKKAAEQFGHFDSAFCLGKMHYEGDAVERSTELALRYLVPAAQAGSWGGSVRHGFDRYMARDIEGAVLNYEIAAEQGYAVARGNLAFLLDSGMARAGEIYHDVSTLQDNDDPSVKMRRQQRAFRQYMLVASEDGDGDAMLRVGDYYYYGLGGVTPDSILAARWYSRASAKGLSQASYNMGFMHEHGFGVPKNPERARRYYHKVAEMSPLFETRIAIYLTLFRMDVMSYFEGMATTFYRVVFVFVSSRVVSSRVVLCQHVLCRVVSCRVISRRLVVSCPALVSPIVSCPVQSCRVLSLSSTLSYQPHTYQPTPPTPTPSAHTYSPTSSFPPFTVS